MAKRARNKVNLFPYVAKRPQEDGTFKPRFVPGERERAMGYKGADLKHEDGRWFTLDEASGWALAKQAEITEQRKTGKKLKSPPVPRGRTVADLWNAYINSDEFNGNPEKQIKGLAKSSQSSYKRFIKPLAAEPVWHAPVTSLDPIVLKGIHTKVEKERGRAMANCMMAAIGSALSWGRLRGWLPKNRDGRIPDSPARHLELESVPPRLRIGLPIELTSLIAASDLTVRNEVTLSAVGDAIVVGLYSGQRKSDVLSFIDGGMEEGRFALIQHKTKARVSIPYTPRVADRLVEIRQRRERMDIDVAGPIVLNEAIARPYAGSTFAEHFRAVRDTAVAGVVDEGATAIARAQHAAEHRNSEPPTIWKLEPCPSVADFTFPDLRDTSVTWYARAGATVPEIASITGHSLASIYKILKHYLALDAELADSAVRKLVSYMDREGLAV